MSSTVLAMWCHGGFEQLEGRTENRRQNTDFTAQSVPLTTGFICLFKSPRRSLIFFHFSPQFFRLFGRIVSFSHSFQRSANTVSFPIPLSCPQMLFLFPHSLFFYLALKTPLHFPLLSVAPERLRSLFRVFNQGVPSILVIAEQKYPSDNNQPWSERQSRRLLRRSKQTICAACLDRVNNGTPRRKYKKKTKQKD